MSEDVSSIDGRPPSEMLVDLHVAVVPMDHWVEKLNHASHKVIRDTFSAGFLRVLPETSVAKLRHHIAEQLGKDIFPKDYIFLKHVGRCLALVRQKQERQLKVKNFLPPHSIMPEIYVLPGQPKMYNYSVLPPIKPHFKDLYNPMLDNDSSPTNTRTLRSNAEPISNSRAHVFDNDDSASESFNKSLEIMPQQIQQEEDFDSLKPGRFPVGAPKSNQQLYENLFKVENRTTEKKYDMKHHKRHVSGKSSYDQDLQHSTSSSNFHETQNEVATPDLTFGNSSGNHSNDIPGNHMDLSTDGSQETEEGKKLQQAKSVLHEGPKKRKVRYNMPPESNSNASSQDLDMHEPTKLLTDPTDFDVKHTIRNYEVREHDSSPNHRHKAHFEPSEISLDPQPIPNTYNSAYIQPARPKKQFVNTSSYDLFQPIQSTFRSFDDPYYFKHNTSKVPAARSMDAMHESNQDHSEHVNFSSSTLIANSQPLILNHEKSAIVTGIVVGSATVSQTSEHFEQTRTTSAYEDSGFIEQEQSDSDENNNNKAEERRIYPLYNPEEVNRSAQNGGEESIHAAPTVHNLDMVWKNSKELCIEQNDNDYNSHNSSHSIDSWGQNINSVGDARSELAPNENSSRHANYSEDEDLFVEDKHKFDDHSTEKRLDSRQQHSSIINPVTENFATQSSNFEANQGRVLSQDSSYQYDFYERSGPPKKPETNSDDGENISHNQSREGHGSKLSYRLSQQKYDDKHDDQMIIISEFGNFSQNQVPVIEEKKKNIFSTENVPPLDLKQENLELHVSRQTDFAKDEERDEQSISDGYESSDEDFRRELENLTARQVKIGLEENVVPSDDEKALDRITEHHHPNYQSNLVVVKSPAEKQIFERSNELLSNTELSAEKTKANQLFAPVVAIVAKGNPEQQTLINPPLPTTGTVFAVVTAASVLNKNDNGTCGSITLMPDLKDMLDDDNISSNGLSRGAPDGMPTQQRLHTSRTEMGLTGFADDNPSTQRQGGTRPESDEHLLDQDENRRRPLYHQETQHQNVSLHTENSFGVIEDANESKDTTISTVGADSNIEQESKDENNYITKDSAVKGQLSSHKDLQRNQPAVVHPESNSSTFVEAPTPLEPIVAKQDKNSDNPIRNFEQDNKKSASNFDRVNLWKELQKIRSERQEAEKKRQELVKQAKISTTKMNQKRSSVRDLWKKKFFEEKKRTLPLEDICRRLQGELDTSHQRLVSAMEGTKPVGTRKFAPILPSTRHAPSMKNNSRIQATRLQHDMDSIRRKIEDAKVKLTGEIKLRHQAEQDVKSMRQELLSKKIRVHIAYRKITRGHHFPLDIKSNA